MNIRTRCLTGIVPMFAILGAATGLLVSFLQYREKYWGLSEEAAGLATAAAEFIDAKDLNAFADGSLSGADRDRFLKPLNRIVRTGSIQRMAILSGADRRLLLDLGPAAQQEFATPDQAGAEAASIQHLPAKGTRAAVMRAFADLPDQGGQPPCILMAQISAAPLTKHKGRVVRQLLVHLLTAVLVGTLCSLLIASILIRAIRDLAQAAEQAANGNYDVQQERSCAIREINDLWNTFQTAASVLRGVLVNSRRQLLDMELLRTEEDLVRAFSEAYQPSRCFVHGSLEWAVTAVCDDQPEVVADLFEIHGTLYAVTGTVAPVDTGLRTAVTASALADCLRRGLETDSLQTALRNVADLFDVVSLRVMAYTPTDQAIAVHTYRQETGAFGEDSLALPNRPLLFHDMDSSLGERLDVFVDAFGNSPCRELLDNVLSIAHGHEQALHGGLTVVAPIG